MIELNITTEEAIKFLKARIIEEKRLRVKAGLLSEKVYLSDLSFAQLLPLVETAAFDLVFLLPTEVFVEESNLPNLITKAFNELANIFDKEEFRYFSIQDAKRLIAPIKKMISDSQASEKYKWN